MGGVFLRRTARPRTEIVNDYSQDISTFYRVLQRHYVAFLDMLRFQITSRAEFERLCLVDPATLTDLERAARFLYLQRTAFGGKVVGRNFAMEKHGRGGRFDVTKLQPMLEDLQERMAGVIIERLDFAAFIARYDGPGALFYCDPPISGPRATMARICSAASTSSACPPPCRRRRVVSSCRSTMRRKSASCSPGPRWSP